MVAVRDHFRPEFLNRLDGIIVFDPLDRAALRQILDLMLKKLSRQLSEQGIALDVTPAAREWLVDQHHEPAFGARPLNPHPADPRQGRGLGAPDQRLPAARATHRRRGGSGATAGSGRGAGRAPGLPFRLRQREHGPETRQTLRRLVLDEAGFLRLTLTTTHAEHEHAREHERRPSTSASAGPEGAWRRVVVRPVQLRGRRHLQFSYFDDRRDVTKNYAGHEAARQLDGLLDLPTRSVSVQTARQTLNVQITRSGKAILHRLSGRPPPGAAGAPGAPGHPAHPGSRRRRYRTGRGGRRRRPAGRPRKTCSTTGARTSAARGRAGPPAQALGILTKAGASARPMRGKFTQVNEFLKHLLHVLDDAGLRRPRPAGRDPRLRVRVELPHPGRPPLPERRARASRPG